MGLPKESGFDLYPVYPSGENNLITDVPGVLVGHVTHHDGDINTGVTAILPRKEEWFRDKVIAGSSVINGFGKSVGLVQVDELGTIEAPILMTNTLSIGTCLTGMVKYMLRKNPAICKNTTSINCVVTECNDAAINDARGLHVAEEDVYKAVDTASVVFEEGAVGGGAGMTCMGFKGGIGSASRVIELGGKTFTVGGLVMTNFGGPGTFVIGGRHVGLEILNRRPKPVPDIGSIILVTATDLPLSARQTKRLANRAAAALGRVGSTMGTQSGDISIAFSTANVVEQYPEGPFSSINYIHDYYLDGVFTAAVEALEESVVSALWHAETTSGNGQTFRGFREVWEETQNNR
ncbi:MAG: P1 family peptidase [Clostridia bacterium]|nr:P1 family peptidase [Clostridia bacterium]